MLLIPIFSWVLGATLRASILVLVILLLQRLLRSRLSARWKYAIWTPVLLAILIPAQPLLPHWEWPVANESHTTSRVDSASNVAAGSSTEVDLGEVDLGFDQQSTPSDTNIDAVQPVEEVAASAVDIARATPANSEVQALAGEDAEIAFTDVGVADRSKSVDSSGQSRDWRAILATGWLLGAVCLSVVVWVSYAATLRRIRRRAISVEQVDLARVQSLAKELGLRRTPKIWLSPEVKAPAVCGAFRPKLLLNDSFFHMLSRDEADFVLRHELMHIRRGDVLLNTMLFGLLSLHWFNPLLWFAFFRAGADREAACDEDVLHTESPARRVAYGKTLLRLEAVLPQSGLCLGFVGMVQKGKRLRERIQFISNPKRMGFSMKSLVLLCMCVTAIFGIAKSAEPQLKPKTQQSTLATDERRTEESKGETPQQEPLKFRKVASLESPGAGLSLARIAVSLDQESVIARVLSGDRGGANGGVQFRRYDVVLQDLDPESPKRTSLGDHYFGFVPKSNLAFVVRWGAGVRFWNTVSHAPSGDYMPHELREDTTILPAVSPDGKVMVTRSKLDHLQFWNIQTRKPITKEIKQRGLVSSMRFSADGKWFFCRASGGLSVRDPQTGNLVVGDVRHDAISYAYSSDTKQLLTVESSHDEEDGWRSDLVIRSGKTFAERRRVQVAEKARSVEWIDNSHVLIVGRNPALPPSSNERETLYVVSLADDKADVRVLMRYNWIRDAVVAPDRKHFITRTREQTSCWRVGEREPVWTKPGDHLVAYGDRGWVLFHNGPVVAYSLLDGSELWRGEDVRLCKVFGSKIWTCNDDKMEFWQVEPGTGPPKPGDQPAPPKPSNAAVRSPTYVPAPDERLLKEKNVGDSTEQLWRFLKNPALPPWEPPLEEWLGHFDERAAWDAEITMYRLKARGMKRYNPDDVDRDHPEFVRELKDVLAAEHAKSTPRVVEAAIRLLHHRKPPDFAKKLINIAPSLVSLDENLRHTLVDVLAATARENEDPPAELVAATKSPTAIVRALATRSLIRAGEIKPAAAAPLCEDETPTVRWEIAMGLIDCHAKDAIPILIDLIPDVQGQRAAHLQRLLRHMAGTGPAQQHSDEKAASQKAWREWWNANAAKVTSEQVTHGYTLLFSHTHVGEMDLSGKFVWRTEFRGTLEMEGKLYTEPTAASMLPNGNILLGESWRQWRPRHRRVSEMTRTGHEVWHEAANARSCEGLKDGRALVCTLQALFIIGSEIKMLHPHSDERNFIMAKAKPDGGFAVIGSGPDGQEYGELIEFDSSGAVTRTTRLPEKPNDPASWAFVCLPNGHMLISRDREVLELDADRKLIRTFARIAWNPKRIQRLANGNILFANDDDLLEYSPAGEKLGHTEFPNRMVFVSRR